jgi:hypothetical protein
MLIEAFDDGTVHAVQELGVFQRQDIRLELKGVSDGNGYL